MQHDGDYDADGCDEDDLDPNHNVVENRRYLTIFKFLLINV